MAADADERERLSRAQARAARMTVARVRFGDESAAGPFGLEGMVLAAKLSFAAMAFAGQTLPRSDRTEAQDRLAIAVRWIPAR
jgi:hypothetical protein